MKNIIPFRKEIVFDTNIEEITSISLEHELSINKLDINGKFIVSGDYKVSDNSKSLEPFEYVLYFEDKLNDNYDTTKATVDVDDFYYEIINNKILSISIDICIDKIVEILIPNNIPSLEEKKDIIEELFEENNDERNKSYKEDVTDKKIDNSNRCIEDDDILPGEEGKDNLIDNNHEVKENKKEKINDKINSIFNNVGEGETYVAYNVYIIREGDTIESIIEKYKTNEEELKKYNNLSDIKLGDKLIIPANK